MSPLAVRGIGVCASGLPRWIEAASVLAGTAEFRPAPISSAAPEGLTGTERRRVNETSRLACLAALDALRDSATEDRATVPTIFVSSDGDGAVLAQMLHALAQRSIVVSPTAFHNSVYNAPAGYWSIAARSTAPSITLCADDASFAAGLIEACAQVEAAGRTVLLVAVDAPFPAAVRSLGGSSAPFACALALGPADDTAGPRIAGWAIRPRARDDVRCDDPVARTFSGNAAAAALPLLTSLALAQSTRVALPYFEGDVLELDVIA